MNCAGCGLKNLPPQEVCAFCSRALEGGGAGRRAEWERLGPALREEFSRAFESSLAARRERLARLRRGRARHAVAGACFNLLLLGFVHGPLLKVGGGWAFLAFLADASVGAGLGLLVNRIRGGAYRGMTVFAVGFVMSTTAKVGLGIVAGPFEAGMVFGLLILPGLLLTLCLGYVFGLNMDLRRGLEE